MNDSVTRRNVVPFLTDMAHCMQVDKERADKEGWWYKPEYLFNELNINSAMASPGHGEILPLDSGAEPFTMNG
jgi:nitrate reductase (NAD(P)H)